MEVLVNLQPHWPVGRVSWLPLLGVTRRCDASISSIVTTVAAESPTRREPVPVPTARGTVAITPSHQAH